MADETVRNLERRWRETQTSQDLSAWLRARQQSGELSQVRLRLAARLGSAVARELVGLDSPEPLPDTGPWWDTVQQLVRSTGLGAAEARARFVLTGQAGAPASDPGIEGQVFVARAMSVLATAVSPQVTLHREDVARAVAALAAYAQTQRQDYLDVCEARVSELELSVEELRDALPAERQEWLDGQEVPEGEAPDIDAIARRLSWQDEDTDSETLDHLIPLCAFTASRACCQLDADRALSLAEYVLGTQEVADAVGAALVPWVLQLD